MTPQEIIDKLFPPFAERVEKAKGMAIRGKVSWKAVLDAMTDEQRAQVASV